MPRDSVWPCLLYCIRKKPDGTRFELTTLPSVPNGLFTSQILNFSCWFWLKIVDVMNLLYLINKRWKTKWNKVRTLNLYIYSKWFVYILNFKYRSWFGRPVGSDSKIVNVMNLLYLINKRWKTRRNKVRTHSFSFFPEMTSKQVNDENEALSNTMYKLLKKYQAIRSILKTLNVIHLMTSYYIFPFDDVIQWFPIQWRRVTLSF